MNVLDNDDWEAVDRQVALERAAASASALDVEFRAVPNSGHNNGNMSLFDSVGQKQRYTNSNEAKAARKKELDDLMNLEPNLMPMNDFERKALFKLIFPQPVVRDKGIPFTPFTVSISSSYFVLVVISKQR